MDTTLRDGEQTPDVAYTPAEKLQLARILLEDLCVNRIEVGQARVSEGEREAVTRIARWARERRLLSRVEIMGYCDHKASADWIVAAGGRVMNLLIKGSRKHCETQLRATPEQHRAQVAQTIRYAHQKKLRVNVYLEDWSNGVRDSFDYVFVMVELLKGLGVQRIYLADTLGVLSPDETRRYVELMVSTWPDVRFEFHAHNDYGLATANCLAAVKAGAHGVHTSVNGMGERTGNTRLAEVVAALHDHSDVRTDVDESRLAAVSRLVETFSGKDISANTPIVGRDVFTQTGGIHADGDAKGDLYANRLAPKRFGQQRRYALGKLSGKASLDHNLRSLGIELRPQDRELVLERIVELGDKKHTVGAQDLPYIIADVLKSPGAQRVRVESYEVTVGTGAQPQAEVVLAARRRRARASASGDGGYDAFMNALRKAARRLGLEVAQLADFRVRIPPGGRSAALVETVITWKSNGRADEGFSTLGVDSDQLAAAVIATEKMLNALALCACASTPEVDPRYQPASSVLEVIAVLQQHVPDDTYRFPPARDFTGRNVYRSALLRLENLEHLHADGLRAGHLDGAIAFAKGRALERLRGYDLAADAYRLAAEREPSLAEEALRSAGLCDRLAEATAIGVDLRSQVRHDEVWLEMAAPPVVLGRFEERSARLQAIAADAGATQQAFVAQEEIERADVERARYFTELRRSLPDGDVRAVAELQRVADLHAQSKNAPRHLLALADLYVDLATEYVERNPPESMLFDPAEFEDLVDSAARVYEMVAARDGTPERIEASRRLEAFIAFSLSIDRERFTP